jgi:hypothetical protein
MLPESNISFLDDLLAEVESKEAQQSEAFLI